MINPIKPKIDEDMAYKILREVSPDAGGSCICPANIIEDDYDLHIIVPMYNVEKYIENCVDSIANQDTRYSVFITIVNDGSKDGSRDILNKYEGRSNIEIIDQENKGISEARNRALKRIRGKYVMFVDSDDYLLDGAIENLMTTAFDGGYDIVQGGFTKVNLDGKHLSTKNLPSKEGRDYLLGFPWGKVFKNSMFKNICFPEGYWFEDSVNSRILFNLASRTCSINALVYAYRINPNSSSHSAHKNPKIIDTIYITEGLLRDQKNLGIEFDIANYNHFLRQVAMNQIRVSSYEAENLCPASFAVHKKLRQRYYTDLRTNIKSLQPIEESLIKDNYLLYRFACGII